MSAKSFESLLGVERAKHPVSLLIRPNLRRDRKRRRTSTENPSTSILPDDSDARSRDVERAFDFCFSFRFVSSADFSEIADRRHRRSAENFAERRGENLEQILDVCRRNDAEAKLSFSSLFERDDENRRFTGDDRRAEFDENSVLVRFGNNEKPR